MEDSGINIFALGFLFFIVVYFLYLIYYAIGLYDLNPFLRPLPLKSYEKLLLEKHIPSLKYLSVSKKEKFYKRVAWFKTKKTFFFKSEVVNREEIILLISAAGMLLTLGFRSYKFIRTIRRIVIHPTDYYSRFNKQYHLGEYNPGMKALAFAADTLTEGFEDASDNLNLAIHEFAHALYFETTGKSSWEALRFQWGFRKLKTIHSDEKLMSKLLKDDYFRTYASANSFEFLAVISEHFVETPRELKSRNHSLYNVLEKMYNISFLKGS